VSGELALLMALRTQGLASVPRAAVAAGVDTDAAAKALADFADSGLAKLREGRATGYMLLPPGSARLDELLSDEGLRSSDALADGYDRFMQLNTRVLKVCSEWQLREDDVPNDHSDRDYDAAVIDRLTELHRRCAKGVGAFAEHAQRYGPYSARLDDCVERLHAGDTAAFTAVLAESYHTVWFELHQDLLLTLGREREEYRLGMPRFPSQNCGRNVATKPKKMSMAVPTAMPSG
jgi:hypothetical protein